MADDISAVVDEVEIGTDDAQVADAGDAGAPDLPALEGKTEAKEESGEGDGRTLPQWIRNLKANDPEGFKAAKAEFFGRRAFAQEFPGGMDEAKSVKAFVAEHGGLEGAQRAFTDLQAKAQELDGIQERIANADVSLIADIPPESIGKLAPAMMTEWAKNDFDGYNAQLSGVFANTIAQAGVPMELERGEMHLELLRDAIIASGQKENAAIVRAFNGIEAQLGKFKKFAGSFAKVAATPITAKAKDTSQLDVREQSIAQKEAQYANTEFDNSIEKFKAPLIETEMKTWFDKAPGDSEKKDAAIFMLRERINQALAQEQKEKGKNSTAGQVLALRAQGKMDDALRIIRSREATLIKELAPKVGRIIYGTAEAPKTAEKPKPTVTRPVSTQTRPNRRDDPWDAAFA